MPRPNKNLLRICVGLIGLAGIAYLSACTYIWKQQKHFIFMPEREIKKTPADYHLAFEDLYLEIPSESGRIERIHCWWIPADHPSDKYLIYLHGSALNIGANVSHARRFKELGFSVLLISYRGYGQSDGEFPTEAQVYADAEAAWRYLIKQRKIKPGDIFIYGHSLGGAVAINLAISHPEAKGLIVEATFTSIADMGRQYKFYRLLPLGLITHQRFDSIEKVNRLQVPVLFIHGTDDRTVPPEMSRQLYQRTTSSKQLTLISGGGHNNSASVGGDTYLEAVRDFVYATGKPI
ncbi:MAG: alpha/beta fold hydrolase [Desulfobacterales bacterium]